MIIQSSHRKKRKRNLTAMITWRRTDKTIVLQDQHHILLDQINVRKAVKEIIGI
jgi:hypothetical protein